KYSLRPLRRLYGDTEAAAFGALKLKAVRQDMVDGGWARTLINKRVRRLVRVFKWAASEELVPVAVYQSLATVGGLQKGRTAARETDPVLPVDLALVEATLPHLQPTVAALVRLQLATGMRPAEACRVRLEEIDRTGDGWVYRPDRDKDAPHGNSRGMPAGPKGMAVRAAVHDIPRPRSG